VLVLPIWAASGCLGPGALIGVAAGIKLTPAFFVVYLLVTRQFRRGGRGRAFW